MAQPFALFPWDKPFLEHLQAYMCDVCANQLGTSVLIVPHNRPRRYFMELLRQNTSLPRPALLPRMLTIGEMVGLFRAHSAPTQAATAMGQKAAMLDAVHLMYRAVQEVGLALVENTEDDLIAVKFAQMDLATFLPWGVRLVNLFEEYMNQFLPVQDILYTEGEVSPMASALLGALGRIHTAYRGLLLQEGWSTVALDAYLAAEALAASDDVAAAIPPLLLPDASKNTHVFVAGFSTITQCEHVLLKALWQKGAHICLHSDPALALGTSKSARTGEYRAAHWSCQDHVTWVKRWNTSCDLVVPTQGHKPQMHFMAGYDVHSQLLHMQETLKDIQLPTHAAHEAEQAVTPSVAVVLASSSLLMPTLHHLPDTDFNVSMGYPLEKSSLFALVENVMHLQEEARGGQEEGSVRRYHWRELLYALRHPFVQMLAVTKDDKKLTLHSLLGHIEKKLRTGSRFVSQEDVLNMAAIQPEIPLECVALFKDVLEALLHNFASIQSTQSLGEALARLCHCLLQYGQEMWKRYPLDAESLYRLMQHVIPTLKVATLAQEVLPQKTLFALCRQLIAAERVPFEAAPLTGLQVLGMLETRLLHFDKVVIVDATDDALPGFSAQDPLLPDALRQVIGLPALQERERVVAHTLYRLAASAKDVHLYWQEGMQRSALFDGKKSRSRFVDAYLWEEEQERGYLLENDTPPLFSAPCPVAPIEQELQVLTATPALRQNIIQLLEKGISPTKIDAYIRCPQRFIWENLYKLRPLDEVNEGDDPAAVGNLLHEVLQQAYTPWIGKEVPQNALTAQGLAELFEHALCNSAVEQTLPPQSLMLLRMAAPVRLKRFLEAQAEQAPETEIVALERDMLAPVKGQDQPQFHIKGKLDRVDSRVRSQGGEHEEGLVVLDYKTGRLPRVNSKVWEDMDLWTALSLWQPSATNTHEVLELVAEAFSSVQLPCYIYMCQQLFEEDVLDAALVDLGNSGKEVYLLGEKMEMDTRADIVSERIPQLLTFIIQHLATAEEFPAREGNHCTYCPYGALCKR